MTRTPTKTLRLRTAAWYGDRDLELEVPAAWDVRTFWPSTPPPLSDGDLAAALDEPVGQPPLRELAVGKRRPVIIVDDLARPTPAHRIIPLVLRHLEEAGLRADQVTVVMGGGTHRPATFEQVLRKVGPSAEACRLVVHDQNRDLVRMGRTSFGSPILVNREVAASDLLIGIGGVYPQHSVGFGGGSKLLLGVLGRRSIISLHYGHPSVAGTYDVDNDFRRDLDEMARQVRLRTVITLHVNADRDVVRIVTGDHHRYYAEAVAFSKSAYGAPSAGDADVVVANAYPMDVSLTFTRSKGLAPLYRAAPGASRVLISSCSEGLGQHGLFPFLNGPRFEKQIHILRRLSVIRPATVPAKIARRLNRAARMGTRLSSRFEPPPVSPTAAPAVARRILFYAPGARPGLLPAAIPNMSICNSWPAAVAAIEKEQGVERALKVAVYPCSPLHCLDLAETRMHDHLAGAAGHAR